MASDDLRAHDCPPNCHPCPLLNGDIMPRCAGTASLGGFEATRSLSRCTCEAPLPVENSLRAEVHALAGRVAQLEAQLSMLLTKE